MQSLWKNNVYHKSAKKWFFGISLPMPQHLTGIKHNKVRTNTSPSCSGIMSNFTKLPMKSAFQRNQRQSSIRWRWWCWSLCGHHLQVLLFLFIFALAAILHPGLQKLDGGLGPCCTIRMLMWLHVSDNYPYLNLQLRLTYAIHTYISSCCVSLVDITSVKKLSNWSEQYISAQILMKHANKCDWSTKGTLASESLGGGVGTGLCTRSTRAAYGAGTAVSDNRYKRPGAVPSKLHYSMLLLLHCN